MEIKGFPFHSKIEEKFINKLCSLLIVIQLDEDIVEKVIAIRKKKRIKLPDAIILATAVAKECKLITRNTNDFEGHTNSVKIINPFA